LCERRGLVVLGAIWMMVTVFGLGVMWVKSTEAGKQGDVPLLLPDAAVRNNNQPRLLLFAHPKCPCTNATLEGLAWVKARAENLDTTIFFYLPDRFPEEWVHTDLWNAAQRIPGVTIVVDRGGKQARRFGAQTSGFTVLYIGSRLVFKGGLTPARGHAGDSVGRDSIPSLITNPPNQVLETAVFGCPLIADDSDCEKVPICQHQ